MKFKSLIALFLTTASLASPADVRGRTIYFCNQVVTRSDMGTSTLKPFLQKNSTKQKKTPRTWNFQSHVVTVYDGGGKPTVISLDGVNVLTPAANSSSETLLGKAHAGYTAFTMDTDSGLADEWGAVVFFESKLMAIKGGGDGKMIFRTGLEEGAHEDRSFYCTMNESGVWNKGDL